MKILFLTEGRFTPASRFRVQQYVPYFEKDGISCKVVAAIPCKYGVVLQLLNFKGGRFVSTRASCFLSTLKRFFDVFYYPHKFDVVFIQRDLSFLLKSPILELIASRKNPNCVFDIDDFICMRTQYDENKTFEKKIRQIIDCSKMIIVGNRYLKEWVGAEDKTEYVPTCIDTARFVPKPKSIRCKEKVVIGWTGTSSNFPYLLSIQPVLEKLADDKRLEIRIISNKPVPEFKRLNIKFIKWSPLTEVEDLQELDIGLVPLLQNKWTLGKCALKASLYMSVGIPVVASPVGHICKLVKDTANGFFVNTHSEWIDKVFTLVQEPNLRFKMGICGRKEIEEKYSVSAYYDKYVGVLKRCIGS